MKWQDILKILGPAILAINPRTAPIAPLVIAGIEVAEAIPGKTGPEKKALVLELVRIGASGTNLVAQRDVINPTDTASVVGSGIDTVIGAINLVHRAQPAPPTP